jgi:Putative porin
MRQVVMRSLATCALAALALTARAQTPASPAPTSAQLEDVRRELQAQHEEIERLRATVAEQTRLLQQLLARATKTSAPAVTDASYSTADVATTDTLAGAAGGATTVSGQTAANKTAQATSTPHPTEITTGALSSISFSGDLRLRYEGQFGQLNALPNSANPAILGNELSARNRARVRLRFAVRGQFGREVAKGEREFQWGLRLASGTYGDVNSSNQTLTDFFTRKAFGIDQAYMTYKPARVPGLRLQAGKFEPPWLATEMTIDVDVMPEGLNELYARDFKNSKLTNLTFVAWQLPMLERASAFVLGADGHVRTDESRRQGRDLALYGAQVHGRFDLTPQTALTLSAADLYYSGTQFITPAQFFGGQLQVPVTFTIPATATNSAQTITTTISIPRDALVTGLSVGTTPVNTNAVNRDGHLSSGFNLVDLIARLDLTHSKRFPVTLLLNVVRNTQTHDVVLAGATGANRVLPNHEDTGLWAEFQVGKSKAAGDVQFGYTYFRIEKDAVLTPFNLSDILQGSDVRVHRLGFTYTVDPRVQLTLTDLISQRPHGLLGAFGTTPPGSLNHATHRLEFDTVFRF